MKVGSEDKKKLIAAGSLGAIALAAVVYNFAGSSSDVAPSPTPAAVAQGAAAAVTPRPNPVARVSKTATDPSLHPEGMVLAEELLYTGSGRNIFAANSVPVVKTVIPKPIGSARNQPVYAPVMNPGPPPPPPIDLRFFGTATRGDGTRQAFFLRGDDVFLASAGDVVSRRYKVGTVGSTSVEVTDLTNNNTQRLPLTSQ